MEDRVLVLLLARLGLVTAVLGMVKVTRTSSSVKSKVMLMISLVSLVLVLDSTMTKEH